MTETVYDIYQDYNVNIYHKTLKLFFVVNSVLPNSKHQYSNLSIQKHMLSCLRILQLFNKLKQKRLMKDVCLIKCTVIILYLLIEIVTFRRGYRS